MAFLKIFTGVFRLVPVFSREIAGIRELPEKFFIRYIIYKHIHYGKLLKKRLY
jgi:hypothetical protein